MIIVTVAVSFTSKLTLQNQTAFTYYRVLSILIRLYCNHKQVGEMTFIKKFLLLLIIVSSFLTYWLKDQFRLQNNFYYNPIDSLQKNYCWIKMKKINKKYIQQNKSFSNTNLSLRLLAFLDDHILHHFGLIWL